MPDPGKKGKKKKGKKKTFSSLKRPLDFFEHSLSLKDKGSYRVWRADIKLLSNLRVPLYLHAVNDSKPVYRITNRFAALPSVTMEMTESNKTTKKKELVEKKTSSAHRCFRFNMGFNDGSDRLRTTIGLSGRYYRSWPKHLVAKTLEDGIINAYGNYLLDPHCPVEPFVVFMIQLIDELLTSGKDLRTRDMGVSFRRSYARGSKRPVPGSDAALRMGEKCSGGKSIAAICRLPIENRTKKCPF